MKISNYFAKEKMDDATFFQKFIEKLNDLTDEDIKLLRNELANYHIEGDLRREITMNIKRLQEINSYRGMRHKRNLPCRGQRTKTNARTRRGKKSGPVSKKK